MKTLIPFLSCLFLLVLSIQSCQNNTKPGTDPKEVTDSLPDLKSRTSNVRGMSAEEVFLRVPNEALQIEGWDKFSTKYRKELIQKGKLDGLTAEVNGNYIKILEKFANEDDDNERVALLDMVVFRHSEDEANIVFVAQKYHFEDKYKSDEILSQKLWQYDGKNWVDITSTLPAIETKMFFDKSFDVSAAKEHFIVLGPAEINENTLNASLMHNAYAKFGLKSDKLMTNESYTINLIWNGQSFELQRKPNELN